MPLKFGEHLQEPEVIEVPVIIPAAPTPQQTLPDTLPNMPNMAPNMCTGLSGVRTTEISAEDVQKALAHTMESEAVKLEEKKKLPTPTPTPAQPEPTKADPLSQHLGVLSGQVSGKRALIQARLSTKSNNSTLRRLLRQLSGI